MAVHTFDWNSRQTGIGGVWGCLTTANVDFAKRRLPGRHTMGRMSCSRTSLAKLDPTNKSDENEVQNAQIRF